MDGFPKGGAFLWFSEKIRKVLNIYIFGSFMILGDNLWSLMILKGNKLSTIGDTC